MKTLFMYDLNCL